MQLKRIATWAVLAAAVVISLIDSFPSAKNLARLEFLSEPSYFIFRTLSFGALLTAFGLMFLISNRLTIDQKTGMKHLIMASPIYLLQNRNGQSCKKNSPVLQL
jgi:vacuolar-type H+-ATPase subunit I/STV1